MDNFTIGKTISDLRKAKGWTQAELAKKLNVSDKTISKWESEVGFPEISQFPVMAKLFDVTVDYLMTGKSPEKEIITMSKAELCAKNDDISLIPQVINLAKDESGKNIVDYILQYQSLNVFVEACKTKTDFITHFEIIDALKLVILANSLELLRGKTLNIGRSWRFSFKSENDIKQLFPCEDEKFLPQGPMRTLCIIPRDFFATIVSDKRISDSTIDFILSPLTDKKYVWYYVIPYLVDESYKCGNLPLLHKLLTVSRENNSYAYNNIEASFIHYENSYNYDEDYYFVHLKYDGFLERGHGMVRILESTIKLALEKGDFDLVDEFNAFNLELKSYFNDKLHLYISPYSPSNCYVASNDEIRIAKLKLDKSVSETDLQVQSAIHNGIISIKELSQVNDYSAIQKALYAYPIHPFEILYKLYYEKQWKNLFEIAIDNHITQLADALISDNYSTVENCILKIWTGTYDPQCYMHNLCINNSELYVDKNKSEIRYSGKIEHRQSSLLDVVNYLNDVRQRIINEFSNKFNKDKIVSELTKDYFYSELAKGNKEMVIVKLCVRMEAILKCDFHYEGDFSEMLSKFCSRFETSDDESNSYDPYTPNMLDRLRKQRNGIVHSDKSLAPMSENELKECIDYICSMK